MARSNSRRSFLGEVLQAVAGGWLALAALPQWLLGCMQSGSATVAAPEYGVEPARRPEPGAAPDAGTAPPAPARPFDPRAAEYGVRRPDPDRVFSKYGIQRPPRAPDAGLAVEPARPKYGVKPDAPPPRPKYGVEPDEPPPRPKYGVQPDDPPPRPGPRPLYGVKPVPRE